MHHRSNFDPYSTAEFGTSCAFCGTRKKLTREHVWPQWAARLLEQYGPFLVTRGAGQWEAPKVDVKARAVCEECNSGWMSRLEERTAPILSQLILTEPIPGATKATLTVEEQITLATWAAKTILTLEFVNPQRIIPDGEYRQFYLHKRPMGVLSIWLAAYKGGRFATRALRAPVYSHAVARSDRKSINGWKATLLLRHAVFQMVRFGVNQIVLDTKDLDSKAIPLWPQREERGEVWPRNDYVFTDSTIDSLAVGGTFA